MSEIDVLTDDLDLLERVFTVPLERREAVGQLIDANVPYACKAWILIPPRELARIIVQVFGTYHVLGDFGVGA